MAVTRRAALTLLLAAALAVAAARTGGPSRSPTVLVDGACRTFSPGPRATPLLVCDGAGQGRALAASEPALEPWAEVALGRPVDLCRASRETLQTLPGIGPRRAEAIVRYRAGGGELASPDDLIAVPGIGPATVSRLRSEVTCPGW